ncbi:MAG: hypothetical protein ABTQ28_01615, partial [Thauera sp.]
AAKFGVGERAVARAFVAGGGSRLPPRLQGGVRFFVGTAPVIVGAAESAKSGVGERAVARVFVAGSGSRLPPRLQGGVRFLWEPRRFM